MSHTGRVRVVARLATCLITSIGLACGPGDRVDRPGSGPAPPLLLLITVDTLRADRLGAYGSDRGLTPRIDALAAESQVFLAAYAPVPFTLPSITALMTGIHPAALGVRSNESTLPADVPTLARALRDHGYTTAAVLGSWVLRDASGLASGFDHYDDAFAAREQIRGIPERIASQTSDAALAMLDRLTAAPRRFVWVHYQDPHGPYTPPGDHRDRHLDRERGTPDGGHRLPPGPDHTGFGSIPDYQQIGEHREVAFYRAGYDGEISYLDEEIGRLLDGIAERGLLDGAWIVLTADHGESLGENDQWFAHGQRLSAPQLRVPLIVRIPGLPAQQRRDVASLLDVLPTLLARMDPTIDRGDAAGRDLLATGASRSSSRIHLTTLAATPELRQGWIDGDHKLTLAREGDGVVLRLARREDDRVVRSPEASAIARRMLGELRAANERLAQARAEVPQAISEQDAARLRALGYAPAP
jgi:arylsulfatase